MPPISGSQHALTAARSDLARFGATRFGWPIAIGRKVLLYALSNIARSDATRANYTSSRMFVILGGIQIGTGRDPAAAGVLYDGLSILDQIEETANTATMRVRGMVPTLGATVVLQFGSKNNGRVEFRGSILRTGQRHLLDRAVHTVYDLSLIDPTWGLDRRIVSGRYLGSATTIAQQLVATWAPTYSTAGVEANLPTVEGGITFTNLALSDCLTHLAKRIGARWKCDYQGVIHLGLQPSTALTPPGELNTINPTFQAGGFAVDRDLSQFVTRVYVEGGGSTALEAVAPGETILPVGDAVWYADTGGTVVSGPQRLRYTGRLLGGAGSLVGPGAAPSGPPGLTLQSGAPGVPNGWHDYAVVFVTATGKSLPGPRNSAFVAPVASPLLAPTAGTPLVGTGPNPGTHRYAVTWGTAIGETLPGPTVEASTSVTPDPTAAPGATVVAGTGVETGVHDYAVTFVTAVGETTPSPISGAVTTGPVVQGHLDAPATAPTPSAPANGPGPDAGSHLYAVTFRNAAGETTPGPTSAAVVTGVAPPGPPILGTPQAGAGPDPGLHNWAVTFVTALGETNLAASAALETTDLPAPDAPAAAAPTSGGAITNGTHLYAVTAYTSTGGETTPSDVSNVVTVAAIATPPALAVYLHSNGGSLTQNAVYKYRVTYLTAAGDETDGSAPSNAVTTYAPPFTTNLAFVLPAQANAVAARIWRTVGNGSEYRLVPHLASIPASAFGTTIIDGQADAFLSGQPLAPTVNTTLKRTVSVTLPLGAAGTTGRRLYRTPALEAGGALQLLAQIPNNTTTTYTDSAADSALGAEAPASSTAIVRRVPMTIPTGPSGHGITGRRVYRTAAGDSTYRLVAELTNNSTTSFTDSVPDSALGAVAPAVTTAFRNTVTVTALAVGPAGTVAKRLYRTTANGSALHLLVELANAAASYVDAVSDSGLGPVAPTTNTTASTVAYNAIQVTVPVGDSSTLYRRLYRRSAGVGLRLAALFGDNTTTTGVDTLPNASLGAAPPAVTTAYLQRLPLTLPAAPSPLVTTIRIYGTAAGATNLKFIAAVPVGTTSYLVTTPDAGLGALAPVVQTAHANHVLVGGIPLGAAAVTAREVYRTAAGGAALQLLTVIPNNTATTFLDTLSDGALGAAPPVSDTSALQQPTGIILPGATTLLVASPAPFVPTGGWAVLGGSQVIRYTGVSGNTLTGIPSSGTGALTAAVSYNTTIMQAAQLTGIPASGTGAVVVPIPRGDDVNLWVQVDDAAAQATLAGYLGGDGIQETFIQDRRLGAAEATARGTAHLTERNQVTVTVRYTSRDVNTRAGLPVQINLGPPTNVVGTFTIQRVTIAGFQAHPATFPLYTVEASSVVFSFEDLIRLALAPR